MWITFVAQYETSYPQLILIIWDIDVDKTIVNDKIEIHFLFLKNFDFIIACVF